MAEIARMPGHLGLIGPPPVLLDVARAVHRLSGLCDDLFFTWSGGWEQLPEWPPGSLFLGCCDLPDALDHAPREGWRLIIGVPEVEATRAIPLKPIEWIELPPVAELRSDLPFIVAAWIRRLGPEVRPTPSALARLSRMIEERGLVHVEQVIVQAVAAVGEGELDGSQIESDGIESPSGLLTVVTDDVLGADRPLAALERLLIQEILVRCEWRMQEAADRLGISRVTLWRKLRDHGIERCERD
jgi:hypothetical protein